MDPEQELIAWCQFMAIPPDRPLEILHRAIRQQVELAVVGCAQKANDAAKTWEGFNFPEAAIDALEEFADELRLMLPTAPSEASENDVVRYLRSRAADAAQRRLNASPAVPPRPRSEEDSEEGESE